MNCLKRLLLFCTIGFAIIAGCNEPAKDKTAETNSAVTKDDSNWALIPFTKIDSVNPVMQPGRGEFFCPIQKRKILWEEKDVFNPAIAVRGDTVYMLYRAQDKIGKPDGTSRIGLAESIDGIHFSRHTEPVLFPGNDPQKKYEWQGGCEDPRMIEDEKGIYYMTYTAFDGKTARLMIATSRDLKKWTKYGPAFAKAYGGKYVDKWSKSGSVISTYSHDGKIVATKINGKYWMYWGDQFIWIATSDDLINWAPLEMGAGAKSSVILRGEALNMPELKIVVPTRNKKFDSDLVESGPPAILTDKGIILIFNSRNILSIGDSTLPEGTYAASQVLIDKNDPTKIIARLDNFFMKPDKAYEMTGQVNNVCFVEGLAKFKNKWF